MLQKAVNDPDYGALAELFFTSNKESSAMKRKKYIKGFFDDGECCGIGNNM